MKRLALAIIICATSANAGALKEALTFKPFPTGKVQSGQMVFNIFDHKREKTKVLIQLHRHKGGIRGQALKAELSKRAFDQVARSVAKSKSCTVSTSKQLAWNTATFVLDC